MAAADDIGGSAGRWSLHGRTALVTGGTRGIGRAVVEELAALGAAVHTCSRKEAELGERLKEWEAKGFRVTGSVCDVSVRDQRELLLRDVAGRFAAKLDILINNVGTNHRKPTTEYSADEYSFIMATNLESAYHLCQLAHPLLKASGVASIVFISSVSGVVAISSGSIYAMTKGAMNQLAKNLACEWAKDNIRINSVAPWYIKTSLVEEVRPILYELKTTPTHSAAALCASTASTSPSSPGARTTMQASPPSTCTCAASSSTCPCSTGPLRGRRRCSATRCASTGSIAARWSAATPRPLPVGSGCGTWPSSPPGTPTGSSRGAPVGWRRWLASPRLTAGWRLLRARRASTCSSTWTSSKTGLRAPRAPPTHRRVDCLHPVLTTTTRCRASSPAPGPCTSKMANVRNRTDARHVPRWWTPAAGACPSAALGATLTTTGPADVRGRIRCWAAGAATRSRPRSRQGPPCPQPLAAPPLRQLQGTGSQVQQQQTQDQWPRLQEECKSGCVQGRPSSARPPHLRSPHRRPRTVLRPS
ncbi:hypothetical protein ACQJBY_060388 [Aegilops geniculata]